MAEQYQLHLATLRDSWVSEGWAGYKAIRVEELDTLRAEVKRLKLANEGWHRRVRAGKDDDAQARLDQIAEHSEGCYPGSTLGLIHALALGRETGDG